MTSVAVGNLSDKDAYPARFALIVIIENVDRPNRGVKIANQPAFYLRIILVDAFIHESFNVFPAEWTLLFRKLPQLGCVFPFIN